MAQAARKLDRTEQQALDRHCSRRITIPPEQTGGSEHGQHRNKAGQFFGSSVGRKQFVRIQNVRYALRHVDNTRKRFVRRRFVDKFGQQIHFGRNGFENRHEPFERNVINRSFVGKQQYTPEQQLFCSEQK